MKARFSFAMLPFVAAALGVACGGGESAATSGQGGGGTASSTASTGPGGGASATTGTGGSTSSSTGSGSGIDCGSGPVTGPALALSDLRLGDKDPDGTPNPETGWENYGFDLDGLASSAGSADVCKPVEGASASAVKEDGPSGLDNSFGKNILPLLLGAIPALSDNTNQIVSDGESTLLLYLPDLGAGSSQATLDGRLYTGAKTSWPPVFDGTFCWPVSPDSLSDPGEITSAKLVFPGGSFSDQVWLSSVVEEPVIVQLGFRMPPAPSTLLLTVHRARFRARLDDAHVSVKEGLLGGVLDTEELIAAVKRTAGILDPAFCDDSMLQGVIQQIRQASDIRADGTQDPGATCDGISIGLGFEMASVGIGPIGDAPPPAPDGCP